MKRILVPVDFSPVSQAAAKVAIELATVCEAEIFFLHIRRDGGARHVPASRNQKISDEQRQALAKVHSGLSSLVQQAERAGLKAHQELVFARTQDWIENYLEPFSIDLVVMGSQGAGNANGTRFGSTTLAFIRHAAIPVLVVKNTSGEFKLRRITFASDFKNDFTKAFQVVVDLATAWKSHIDLVYVCTPYHFVPTKKIAADIKRFMHQFKGVTYTPHVYNAVTEESGIHEFAKDNGVDLITLTTEGRTGLARMFKSSIAEGLVMREVLPVLVMNTKRRVS